MEFIDLTSASEDERFEVKGILSNVSKNLEFTCGNKLKNNINNSKNINNNNCNNINNFNNNINNCNNNINNCNNNNNYIKDKIQNGNQTDNYSKSNQISTSQSDNIQNNFKNGSNHIYNYYYSVHHSPESENQLNNHYHHNNNHHPNHYNNHLNSQLHSNHYHNIQHNSHPNNRLQILPAYSTFIPGAESNGPIPPEPATYKMPFFPQYATSTKSFYPNNGLTGPHFTNVLTSISPIAATIATAPTMANNVVTSNQLTEVISEINGNGVHSNNNLNNEKNSVPSYPVTAYPGGPTSANSFVHTQYIPAHPNAHFSTHPMIYLPIHMPQFYHYPHMATTRPVIASHQQLATPPISPPQCQESNLNNPDLNNMNLNYVNDNKLFKNIENKKSQIKTNTNYNFLSPESFKDESEFKNENNNIKNKKGVDSRKKKKKLENGKLYEKSTNEKSKELSENLNDESKKNLSEQSVENLNKQLDEHNETKEKKSEYLNQDESNESYFKKDENTKDDGQNVSFFSSSEYTITTENEDDLENLKSMSLKSDLNLEKETCENENRAKSWADLFKSNKNPSIKFNNMLNDLKMDSLNRDLSDNVFTDDDYELLGQTNNLLNQFSPVNQIETIPIDEDEGAHKLAKKLKDTNLKHSLPFLTPRGFINKSNKCYINSILQALLYCPPFYNLMREICDTSVLYRDNSSTPVIDSFAKFFLNFLPNEQLMRKVKLGNLFCFDDLPKLEPYEPKCIYNALGNINNECLKGHQEDAEEFLASVLNSLHEEMVSLLNYENKINTIKISKDGLSNTAILQSNNETQSGSLSEDEKWVNLKENKKLVWKELKTKHKTSNESKIKETSITDIFGGTMLFVRVAGKDILHSRQSFFSLKLDIQSEKIRTIEDALRNFTLSEYIHGYTSSKTNKAIDASCQIFLDQLPIILILHLKLIYEKDGSVKKLMKKIDYPIDLEIPKECLSNQERSKYSKTYKLLAVVHHEGKETEKGHFLTDIYHIGTSLWLRCNDSKIESISTQQLLYPQNPKIPYLLFYRRCDTLRGSSKNHIL